MASDKLLTFNEARDYLRVNRATLYKLIREKELPAFRVGKQLRIDKGELVGWLQKQRVKKEINYNTDEKDVLLAVSIGKNNE